MRKPTVWRRILILASVLWLWCVPGIAEGSSTDFATGSAQTGLARVAIDRVNFRNAPVSGDIIARLSQNDAVFVLDHRTGSDGNTWYHVNAMVRTHNRKGWIREDMLVLPDMLFHDLIDVSAGEMHLIALKSDGTVIAGGTQHFDPCNVVGIYDVADVEAAFYTSFAIRKDGSLWGRGRSIYEVEDFRHTDVAAVTELGGSWSGLHRDGSFFLCDMLYYVENTETRNMYDAHDLPNIVQVAEGFNTMICLTADGKVHMYGLSRERNLEAESWEDIVKVSAFEHVVGLKADGTVVARGPNSYGECNVEGWRDIIDVAASEHYTLGLKADGTVVATGSNRYGTCNVSSFSNIVQIDAARFYAVGRTAEGKLVFAGDFQFLDKTDEAGRIYMSSGE